MKGTMLRHRTEGALGSPQRSGKLAALCCGQVLANGELPSLFMASRCHQPHGVNGEEVGGGGWRDSRKQPLLASNQHGGGKTLLCMREIMLAPKPIIPKFQKKKKRKEKIFNQTVLLSLNSEWEIVHTAKLAAAARPVKTICRQRSSK